MTDTTWKVKSLLVSALAIAIGMGCGRSEKAVHPIVTRDDDGNIRAISQEEAASVCSRQYCEENVIYTADVDATLEDGDSEEGVTAITAPAKSLYAHKAMSMERAWQMTEGSADVIVAVIDSGADIEHENLKDHYINRATVQDGSSFAEKFVDDFFGWDFVQGAPLKYDLSGHGTHVAGIIAGGAEGTPMRGVAPGIKLLPIRFLDAKGSGETEHAVKSIEYAVLRGAQVISNSWGGGKYSSLLAEAIKKAVDRGIYFVASAGNSSKNLDKSTHYPSEYPGAIAVGSSNASDKRSSFSNYGKKAVDVMAPGSDIFSTYPKGRYKILSGTSMAAPQVSGALALALSLKPGVESRSRIQQLLCETADTSLKTVSRCGRMDVGKFIESVSRL